MGGIQQLRVVWTLCAGAWIAGFALRSALYFRPTPYGGPFVTHWDNYFFHALFYNLFSVFILALPMTLYWVWRRHETIKTRAAKRIHWLLIGLLSLALFADHFDAETMRSMGVHATPSFIATYWKIGGSMDMMVRSMNHDAGGPWSPIIIVLIVIPTYILWARRRLRSIERCDVTPGSVRLWCLLLILPVVLVLVSMYTPGGKFRYRKVRPYLMTLTVELMQDQSTAVAPKDLSKLSDAYQKEWLAEAGDKEWQFNDPQRPYIRTPTSPSLPKDADRWNILLIQVETLRGLEVGALMPNLVPSPTPTLDRLANDPKGALWTRFLTFGPPTVTGTMSGHCSVRPHSRHNVTTRYTYTHLLCLPQILRRVGYQTAYFTGSDPDWDGQAFWLSQWYDEHTFFRDADEADTVVFERATERIVAMGRSTRPFMATVVTISNHYPFNSRDQETDIAGTEAITDRIKNTVHYTDATLGRMLARLEKEPFFQKTLVVIYGDHGYNLGEHRPPGQRNGFHESTWSPLLIYGNHPRLPKGRHGQLANLMDVVPTIADILNIRIPNPWSGHSLLHEPPDRVLAHTKNGITFAEDQNLSMVWDRESGQAEAYGATDMMQSKQTKVGKNVFKRLLNRARDRARLNDYLIEAALIWTKEPGVRERK
jgi:phosphoglycerol transferase MdoB-like AlkP superfamily enzyme